MSTDPRDTDRMTVGVIRTVPADDQPLARAGLRVLIADAATRRGRCMGVLNMPREKLDRDFDLFL